MARVQLRDLATEDDDEAVMGLLRGPGQERYLGPMERKWGEDLLRLDSAGRPAPDATGGRA